MKKYAKEMAVLGVQLLAFYIFPLFAAAGDEMGLMLGLLLSTLILSAILGGISNGKIKFLYPVAVAIAFLPSVWIYYNESAFIHAAWHFAASVIGLLIGTVLREILRGHD